MQRNLVMKRFRDDHFKIQNGGAERDGQAPNR